MNTQNIKSITIGKDGTPITNRYNGSYHPIEHTSTDGLDYSITIWEWYYASVDYLFGDVEEEDFTDAMSQEAWETTLEQLEDFEIKIIK